MHTRGHFTVATCHHLVSLAQSHIKLKCCSCFTIMKSFLVLSCSTYNSLKETSPFLKLLQKDSICSLFYLQDTRFFDLSAFAVVNPILRCGCAQSQFKLRQNLPNWNAVVQDKVCFPLFLQKMTEHQRHPRDNSSGTNNNCKCHQSQILRTRRKKRTKLSAYQKVWSILLQAVTLQQLSCLWPKVFHTAGNFDSLSADNSVLLGRQQLQNCIVTMELLTRGTYFKIASGKANCDYNFTYI